MLQDYKERAEKEAIISKLDYEMTKEVLNGHRPYYGDKFQEHRDIILKLRKEFVDKEEFNETIFTPRKLFRRKTNLPLFLVNKVIEYLNNYNTFHDECCCSQQHFLLRNWAH